MNTLIIIFLSAEDKFMPEMRLKQPEFKFSTSGPKKNKKKKETKEIDYSRYIYQNELDKACFQYEIHSLWRI